MSAMPVMLIQNEIIGQERSLDVISTVGQWRMQMNAGILVASFNGGAWLPFAFGAAGVTLDGAYDFGGAGVGRAIIADAGAVTITNNAANGNNVLELTKSPVGAQLGSALTVTMGANATFGPGIAVSIASPAAIGIEVSHGAGANSSAFSASMSGYGAGFTMLRVDNNNGVGSAGFNYADQASGTNGVRNMPALYMNSVPNFTANGSFAGALNTFRFAPTSQGATTVTLAQPIVAIVHAPGLIGGAINDSSVGLELTMTPANSGAPTCRGLVVNMNPSAAANMTGVQISMNSFNTGRALWIDHAGTTAGIFSVSLRLSGATQSTGIEFDDGNLLAVSNGGEGRIMYDAGTNTFKASVNGGAYATFAPSAAASLQAAYNVGATILVVAGAPVAISATAAAATQGLTVTMGAATTNAGFAATFSSAGTAGEAVGNAIVNIEKTGILTDQTVGLEIDLSGTTPGAFAHIGQRILIPATTKGETTGQSALVIDSRAARQRSIDIQIRNTGGTIFNAQYDSAVTTALLVATIGMQLDFKNFITPGAVPITGISMQFGATTNADAALEGALVINSNMTRERMIDCAVANTGAATGLWVLRYGTATTCTATVSGITVDLSTNINAATAVALTCYTAKLGVNMGTNASVGFAFTRTGTWTTNGAAWNGSAINIQNTPTEGGGGITTTESGGLIVVNHQTTAGAGVITDTKIGIVVTMTPGVASANIGIQVTMGENATGPALDLVSPGAGTNVAFIQLIANSAAPTSDAAAGAANTGRVYVRLNGGGKSELVCRFDSGAVQVVATEP